MAVVNCQSWGVVIKKPYTRIYLYLSSCTLIGKEYTLANGYCLTIFICPKNNILTV